MAGHAYFYFRDAGRAGPGRPASEDESAADKDKLLILKDRIRRSRQVVHENYENARRLGELVLGDFTALIDRLFPPSVDIPPFAAETARQEAFAGSGATRTIRTRLRTRPPRPGRRGVSPDLGRSAWAGGRRVTRSHGRSRRANAARLVVSSLSCFSSCPG
jgi:hypothetical protein